jgi:hypothetical protein
MKTPYTWWSARVWLVQCVALAAALLSVLWSTAAHAQDGALADPPGRVGRVANLEGSVSWFDHEEGRWAPAERNRPLTSGDRLSTAPDGKAELRVGSTVLRLGAATEVEVLLLDDQRMAFQLHSGKLALRVRSRDLAEEIELNTAEARLLPLRAGHYRLDRSDDTTQASAWRGTLRVEDAKGWLVESGQRVELWREGRGKGGELRVSSTRPLDDAFTTWVMREDQQDERTASGRYVSPEMTGAEELDRHGRWDRHPDYGPVWVPYEVAADWAPYRHGRWAYVRPWGWTWVDDSRWGFAPFHYGRWVNWRGRWGWCPGEYVARPTYAPALVAWVGGARVSVGVSIGLPAVAWVPLAPRDWFVPYYRHTPVYIERVNVRPELRPGWGPGRGYDRGPDRGTNGPANTPAQVPTGPVMYGNQGVPGAVTVVPREVLMQRQPVARNVADSRGTNTPWVAAAPPTREAGTAVSREAGGVPDVVPLPGGAVRLPAPERAMERAVERPLERPQDRRSERPQDRSADRSTERRGPVAPPTVNTPNAQAAPTVVGPAPQPQPQPREAQPKPQPVERERERERDKERERERAQARAEQQAERGQRENQGRNAEHRHNPRERESTR